MGEELFNSKTLDKFVENYWKDKVISQKQKKACKDWLELLKDNKLENEVKNYHRFSRIILEELLGYDTRDFNFEDKNKEFSFKDDSGKIFVCFEVKGTKTKDLWASQHRASEERKTPVRQINHYLYRDTIPFGVLTNYKVFVLFDRTQGDKVYYKFENFLDTKNEKKLKEFIAIFSCESIKQGHVLKLREDSEKEERDFTKEFYKLYHETRLMLLEEFKDSGLEREKALHYAQLFLNRMMFVFFAEDTGLIPERIFEKRVIHELKSGVKEYTHHISEEIKGLFIELDRGSKEIKKYNGGLFSEELSDSVKFNDIRNKSFFKENKKYKFGKISLYEEEKELFNRYSGKLNPLIENLLLMASFDFNTEVNVNILGHIFEQSIGDLEDLAEGKISKRKKEGIFYTPEYITDYICRNTIIPYLSKSNLNEVGKLVGEYSDDLSELEDKLQEIKILDPACGSGAFLIKGVDVLLEIHEEIDKYKEEQGHYETSEKGKRGKKTKTVNLDKYVAEEKAKDIIMNNIFGVDINEESVEITKLSLFLKIARKGKKLPVLDNNIRCGNSLIDDKSVDSKAFNWHSREKGFGGIMERRGFDVVIGNPPYVRNTSLTPTEKYFFSNTYFTAKGQFDLYVLFNELALKVAKSNGFISFIQPNKFLSADYGVNTLNLINHNSKISRIWNVSLDKVFEDASVYPYIFVYKKIRFDKDIKLKKLSIYDICSKPCLIGFNNEIKAKDLVKKIECNSVCLKDISSEIKRGVPNTKIEFDEGGKFNAIKSSSLERAYSLPLSREKINYKGGEYKFEKILILLPRTTLRIKAIYKNEESHILDRIYYFKINKNDFETKFVLSVINSKLTSYLYNYHFGSTKVGGGYFDLKGTQINNFLIPDIVLKEQKPFIEKADLMLKLNKEFYEKKLKFTNRINQNLNLQKITKKLNNFFDLDFKQFCEELKKQKVEFSLKEQDEWEDYFNQYKKELSSLKEYIEATDKEIDEMVYKLYGLTNEEIKIVEESLK